jgi:hypothetical protein
MNRLACAFLLVLAACSGSSSSDDEALRAMCAARTIGDCADVPECHLHPGCCGGDPFCVPVDQPTVCNFACVIPCADLPREECVTRSDCVVDLCSVCSCTPQFAQCRGKEDPPYACPALECPQPQCCHDPSDCGQSGDLCLPPGERACRGTCPHPCQVDTDCPEAMICGADQMCAPQPCLDACPYLFHCDGATTLTCQRDTCTSDADCPAAFCDDGQCYPGLGQCTPPVP